jgi:hypothetical protein
MTDIVLMSELYIQTLFWESLSSSGKIFLLYDCQINKLTYPAVLADIIPEYYILTLMSIMETALRRLSTPLIE